MNLEITAAQIGGLLALLGALLYALGDVLMLAPKVGATRPGAPDMAFFAGFPALRRSADLLEVLARMPSARLTWGGLLGVFAAPLVLAGLWPLYLALAPAGPWLALPPVLLFAYGTVVGPFIHGSFIFLGEAAQALAEAPAAEQGRLAGTVARLQRVMVVGYAVIFSCMIGASLWYSAAVALGGTLLPAWMAAANPVVLVIAWMLGRRLLPRRLREASEGAGLNIASFAFFALVTLSLI